MTNENNSNWRELLPSVRGTLPLGGPLVRTEPGGSPHAPIAFLGAYPSATRLARTKLGSDLLLLPAATEATSFEPSSRSGAQLKTYCLEPLGLCIEDVRTFDLMPYFLANTAEQDGRSMWASIERYNQATGSPCAVLPRLPPDRLLRDAREMPGNEERLAEYLSAGALRLLITLGNEAAAWTRGLTRAGDAQRLLYGDAEVLQVQGRELLVVHLAHPGTLPRNAAWRERHAARCTEKGRALVASIAGEQPLQMAAGR
jgi:hypothetical protein